MQLLLNLARHVLIGSVARYNRLLQNLVEFISMYNTFCSYHSSVNKKQIAGPEMHQMVVARIESKLFLRWSFAPAIWGRSVHEVRSNKSFLIAHFVQ